MKSSTGVDDLLRGLRRRAAGAPSEMLCAGICSFLAVLLVGTPTLGYGQTEQVIYRFLGQPDGENPNGNLVLDAKGDLFGTTYAGGANGVGSVFRLTQAGALSPIYNFTGGADGLGPAAGLVRVKGKFFGTATSGGSDSVGTVFELTPTGQETTLASFTTNDGGGYPEARLIQDSNGNLYGTNSGFNGLHGQGRCSRYLQPELY